MASKANRLVSILVQPSANHVMIAILLLPSLNYTVDLGHPLLECSADRRVSLPTIASAKPCSCPYFVLVAFLNRSAAAKQAFEKANR